MRITSILSAIVIALCGTTTSHAQIAPPGAGGMKEMVLSGGLNAGKTYQVAEHCGADAATLKSYRARFDADTRGGDELYARLGVNIEDAFSQGRKDGSAFYASVKATPDRGQVCTQTLALVKSQGAGH